MMILRGDRCESIRAIKSWILFLFALLPRLPHPLPHQPKNLQPCSSRFRFANKNKKKQDCVVHLLKVSSLSHFVPTAAASQKRISSKRPRSDLSCVMDLMEEIGVCSHAALAEVFRDHSFVGCVDSNRCAIQVKKIIECFPFLFVKQKEQHRLNLYLIDVPAVSTAFFYEQLLIGIENFEPISLSPPPMLRDLLRVQLEMMRTKNPFALLSEEKQIELLQQLESVFAKKIRRDMLKEFFAIEISDSLEVRSLPIVLANYTPDMTMLPSLMLRLCTKVNYQVEKECVRNVCSELARFFAFQPVEPAWLNEGEEDLHDRPLRARQIEHILFSAMRGAEFRPPKTLASDGAVRQIASIDQLYKVFERC
jgi:DNA mismatch repair protein MLH1